MDKIAESSVVTYLAKAGEKLTEEKIKQIMDEETWMSAQEAYNYGLCDVVESANQVAASISQKLFETYQKVPEKLLNSRQENSRDQEKIEKIVEHAKQNKALIGTILGGL